MKTAKIMLGEQEYTIHQFNIGELEEVTEAFSGEGRGLSFKVLTIALRRSEPPVPNPKIIEADASQISAAVAVILELAGMKPQNPPEGAPQ